jgi:GT2 family glycosyltransferase
MGEVARDSAAHCAPLLSVIIPVYNSQIELKRCLGALAKSHFEDFEVWIVDDGSTVPIKPLAEAYGFGFVRIDGPSGPACARNRGAEEARGRYVVFIDSDVCVQDDTLALFAEVFRQDPTVDAVIGSYDDTPACPDFISQYKNLLHHYVHQNSRGEIPTFWSGCGAIKRDIFLAFGGYDQQRYRRPGGEDLELGMRMSEAGHKIILDSHIKAKHLKRWTFLNLLRTDILDRGIPWTRLMLQFGAMISTLNVAPVQRLSVVLVYLTFVVMFSSAVEPTMLIAVAAIILIVTLLNLDLYRFYLKRQGLWFTLRVVPMHWLYFLCCGLSVIGGTLLHLFEQKRRKLASISAAQMPVARVDEAFK